MNIARCRHSLLALILLASLLAGCGPFDSAKPESSFEDCLATLTTPTETTGVVVEPDDTIGPILNELDGARCGIDLSVYILTNAEIMAALGRAAERGVRVRVQLEQFPFGGGGSQQETLDTLASHGVEVKWSDDSVRFSHAKYLVVDRQVAVIMNQNLTQSAFDDNREFAAITTHTDHVEQAQRIFDADWSSEPLTVIDGPLIVSPETSRARYLDLISRAQSSIAFYAEVIRDEEIIQVLIAAERRGVAVRLIVDDGIDEDSEAALVTLFEGGVEIRFMNGLYVHAKLMLIDSRLAIVGSQNFTWTSLNDNRELAVVLTDTGPVSRCISVFERDWLQSSPGSPS